MVVPFCELRQHRHAVFNIYRALLRNVLHLPLESLDGKSRVKLVGLLRSRFRRQRHVNNSHVCQELLIDSVKWNNTFVLWYNEKPKEDDPEVNELLLAVNPKLKKEKSADPTNDPLLHLISQNKEENSPPPDIREYNKQHRQLNSWVQLYIERRQKNSLLPHKSKLDEKYVEEIITPAALYLRRHKSLQRAAAKLQQPSSAKLKSVSATHTHMYVIYAPWSTRIFTEKQHRIYEQRKRHDRLNLEIIEFRRYVEKWKRWYDDEKSWEKTIGESGDGSSWSAVFKDWAEDISQRTKAIEEDTCNFNRRQYCLFQRMKPTFDKLLEDSQANMHRLQHIIKAKQVGPYTNIKGEELGELMRNHHFRDPAELKHCEITNPGSEDETTFSQDL